MKLMKNDELVDKYFDDIRVVTNYEFVRGLLTEFFNGFLAKFIEALMYGKEKWELEYVFEKDQMESSWENRIIDYKKSMMFRDLNNVEAKDFLERFSLGKLEMASKIKLILYRLFNVEESAKMKIFTDQFEQRYKEEYRRRKGYLRYSRLQPIKLLNDLQLFRTDTSHTGEGDDAYKIGSALQITSGDAGSFDDEFIFDTLKEILEDLKESARWAPKTFKNGQNIRDLFNETKEECGCILKAFQYARYCTPVEKCNKKPVSFKEIYNYKIYIGYSALRSEYGYRFINQIAKKFALSDKVIYYDTQSVYLLAHEQSRSQSESIKNVIKTLKDNPEFQDGDFIESDRSDITRFPEGEVLGYIKQNPSDKWCVITDEDWIAEDTWNLPTQNGIAVRILYTDQLVVFTGERQSGKSNDANGSKVENKKERNTWREVSVGNIKNNSILKKDDEDIIPVHATVPYKENFDMDADQLVELSIKPPIEGGKVFYGPAERDYPTWIRNILSRGGEGRVHKCDIGDECIKIYYEDKRTVGRIEKLEYMLSLNINLPREICWPIEEIYDQAGKCVVGYSMPIAAYNKRLLGSLSVVNHKIIYPSDEDQRKWTRTDLLDICINIASLFEKLHNVNFQDDSLNVSAPILMGDINPENILLDEDLNVYFIDTDSYQVGPYNCPVGRPEFTSRRLYKQLDKMGDYGNISRTIEDENFACAVLYFYILFLEQFPFDFSPKAKAKQCILNGWYVFSEQSIREKNFIWKNLTIKLQEMFENTFGPAGKIYNNSEWINAFREMRMLTFQKDEDSEPKLSNEIKPSDFKKSETDRWVPTTCSLCGKKFLMVKGKDELAKKNFYHKDDKWCPDCKTKRNMAKMHIYRVRCQNCGKIWTVNRWDANGRSSDDMYCPDCCQVFDPEFRYGEGKTTEEAGEEVFKTSIEMEGARALLQYKKDKGEWML